MILVAGRYRSGTGDDPALIEADHRALQTACPQLFRAGHPRVNGQALPLAELAGSVQLGDAALDGDFHPWAAVYTRPGDVPAALITRRTPAASGVEVPRAVAPARPGRPRPHRHPDVVVTDVELPVSGRHSRQPRRNVLCGTKAYSPRSAAWRIRWAV
jgi:hypothetical protein